MELRNDMKQYDVNCMYKIYNQFITTFRGDDEEERTLDHSERRAKIFLVEINSVRS